MQFLVISKPKADFIANGMPDDFPQLELAEQAHTQVVYAQGTLRQVWARVRDERGAVVLFEADSPDHMQQMWKEFPLIKADYADYEITELAPHPGLARQQG